MQGDVSRTGVESVIDEFEKLGTESFFEKYKFRMSRDYWVLSTKSGRETKKYPSKPIAGITKFGDAATSKSLAGGWQSENNACSILHNAGYIIIGNDDKPVNEIELNGEVIKVPEDLDHLIQGIEYISAVANNYFVCPIRELGENKVEIAVRELHDKLGYQNNYEVVRNALISERFQSLASVKMIEQRNSENVPSSSMFFQLMELEDMLATNQIFYGPPGTGKTYGAISKAVEICLGKDSVDQIGGDRGALMEKYKRLVDQNRVEFVTFHQSFSYEEFVVGLRPQTGINEDNGGNSTSGFSLVPQEGVFVNISNRAKLFAEKNDLSGSLDRNRPIYQIAVNHSWIKNDRIQECLDKSIISLNWAKNVNWSTSNPQDLEAFNKEWKEKVGSSEDPQKGGMQQSYNFCFKLKEGDYVVLANGRDKFVAVGEVAGPYYYENDSTHSPHRRKVSWFWVNPKGGDREIFYSTKFLHHSIFQLAPERINWEALEELVYGGNKGNSVTSPRNFVLIIDEINRANISKVFGELITLLEVDKRIGAANEIRVRLPYSGEKFGVPPNLHIIGTMNTADRSIALLDTALRRRFNFIELMPNPELVPEVKVGGTNLREYFILINKRIEFLYDREHQIGHAYFIKCQTPQDVEDAFRNDVIPLLAEYFYENRLRVAEVLGDLPTENSETNEGCFFSAVKLDSSELKLKDGDSEVFWRLDLKSEFDFSKLKLT